MHSVAVNSWHRSTDNEFKGHARGVPFIVHAGGCFAHLSSKDLWFALLGELHVDPLRFLNIDEIHSVMSDSFGALCSADKARLQLDAPWVMKLRAANRASKAPASCTFEKVVVVPGRVIANARREGYVHGVRATKAFAQVQVTNAILSLQHRLGHSVTTELSERINFVSTPVSNQRRPYARGPAGVTFRLLQVNAKSYGEHLRGLARGSFPWYPIPGAPFQIVAGAHTADRSAMVSLYKVPSTVTESAVRSAIISSINVEPQSVTHARTNDSGRCTWRVVFKSQDEALSLMANRMFVTDSDGWDVLIRHYHHARDSDEYRMGGAADVVGLYNHLITSAKTKVGENNLALMVWEDGISQSATHMVSGLAWLIGKQRGVFARLYDYNGSDSESSVMQIAISFLASRCNVLGNVRCIGVVYDHGMAFSRLNVRAGNAIHGFRNPMVSISTKLQNVVFYGAKRSVSSILREANALLSVCREIASGVEKVEDLTQSAVLKVLRACKVSRSRGVVDCPGVLQYSRYDSWGDSANYKALLVWQRMMEFDYPSWLESRGVLLNMRHPFPLRTDGRLALTSLIPLGGSFSACDPHGIAILFDQDRVSFDPVEPGTRVFLRHSEQIDLESVVFVPPALHCSLNVVVLGLETLMRTMEPGGKVFDQNTDGFTLKQLHVLVDRVKQVILGRGHVVHSYTSLSSFTPLFDAWMDVLGNITHPAVSHLPAVMSSMLRTRVSKDHTLRDDIDRYSIYRMAIIFCPLVCIVEVAELSRRRAAGTNILSHYLAVRANRVMGDVSLDVDFKHKAPLVSSVTDVDVAELQDVEARLQADNNEDDELASEASEIAEKVTAKVNKDHKYRKFGGIYLGSLVCGLPRAIADLSFKSGRNVLLSDVLEDACEARLKPVKRMEAQSNFRHHRGLFGMVVDNLLAPVQEVSESQCSHLWTGEGVKEFRFAPCWLKTHAVASHNIVEAISLALEDSSLRLSRWISMFSVDGCVGGIRVVVGTDGDVVSLCGCGDEGHRAQINAVVESIPFSHFFDVLHKSVEYVMRFFREEYQFVIPPQPSDETSGAIKSALAGAERTRKARVEVEQRTARVEWVRALLVRLGWLEEGLPVDQNAMKRFRVPQDPKKFFPEQFPTGLQQRISFLYARPNEIWRDKEWLSQGPNANRK